MDTGYIRKWKKAHSEETIYIIYKLFAYGYKGAQTLVDFSRQYFTYFFSN